MLKGKANVYIPKGNREKERDRAIKKDLRDRPHENFDKVKDRFNKLYSNKISQSGRTMKRASTISPETKRNNLISGQSPTNAQNQAMETQKEVVAEQDPSEPNDVNSSMISLQSEFSKDDQPGPDISSPAGKSKFASSRPDSQSKNHRRAESSIFSGKPREPGTQQPHLALIPIVQSHENLD